MDTLGLHTFRALMSISCFSCRENYSTLKKDTKIFNAFMTALEVGMKSSSSSPLLCVASDRMLWLQEESAGTFPPEPPSRCTVSTFISDILSPLNSIYNYLQLNVSMFRLQYVQCKWLTNWFIEMECWQWCLYSGADRHQDKRTASERMRFPWRGLCECNMCV